MISKLPCCVVLAAGQSSRFGSQKMLHPLSNGLPLLVNTLNKAFEVFPLSRQRVVVIDARQKEVRALLTQRFGLTEDEIVEVQTDTPALSTSIHAGVMHLPHANAWMMLLADMPYVKSSTLKLLRDASDDRSIVVPVLNQVQGNPVCFGSRYERELTTLSGDRGAKSLIAKYPQACKLIETDDLGVIRDIDQPSDVGEIT